MTATLLVPTRPRSNRPALLDDRQWLAREYVANGRSCRDIAGELGCGHNCVYQALRRLAIPTRKLGGIEQLRDAAWLAKAYRGTATDELAATIGCDPATVLRWLARHNIPRDRFRAASRERMAQSQHTRYERLRAQRKQAERERLARDREARRRSRRRPGLRWQEWPGYAAIVGELVIVNTPLAGLRDQDPLEMLDATWEDENGLLPHQPGYQPRTNGANGNGSITGFATKRVPDLAVRRVA